MIKFIVEKSIERPWIRYVIMFMVSCILLLAYIGCSKRRHFDLYIALNPGEISQPFKFTIDPESEVLLHLKMWSDSDWAVKSKESAVLTLYVDGNYIEPNQDVVLFNGNDLFIYKVLLGRLNKGNHSIEFKFTTEKSSTNAVKIHLDEMNIIQITSAHENYDVFRFSPILYGRYDNYYTDTPLLMYHEVKENATNKTIDYTIIWSNEDGGTDSPGLMSAWGRTTDIELTYRVKLDEQSNILKDYFHGEGHDTLRFAGNRINDHPILRTATLNNVVSDSGKTDYRFFLSPELNKSGQHSREIIMDQHPWTYRIMAKEMAREGKYERPPNPSTKKVSDARNYLYFEFNSSMEGPDLRLTFAVKLKDRSIWYYSDHNDTTVQAVNRGGWRRTTIELPEGTTLNSLDKLKLTGVGKGVFKIRVLQISKIFMLSEDYIPMEFPLSWRGEVVLNEGNPTAIFAFDEIRAQVDNLDSK